MKTEHLEEEKEKSIFQDGADLMCFCFIFLCYVGVGLWLLWSYFAPIVRHLIGG